VTGMRLFIDDERKMPPGYTHHARTVEEGILFLGAAKREGEPFELASFDYDAHSFLNWTFVRIAEWIRDNDYWPAEIRVHTANDWKGLPYYQNFFLEHAPLSTTLDPTNPWDRNIDWKTAPKWVIELMEAQQ
jgi:hypothetical protein